MTGQRTDKELERSFLGILRRMRKAFPPEYKLGWSWLDAWVSGTNRTGEAALGMLRRSRDSRDPDLSWEERRCLDYSYAIACLLQGAELQGSQGNAWRHIVGSVVRGYGNTNRKEALSPGTTVNQDVNVYGQMAYDLGAPPVVVQKWDHDVEVVEALLEEMNSLLCKRKGSRIPAWLTYTRCETCREVKVLNTRFGLPLFHVPDYDHFRCCPACIADRKATV